MEVLIRVEAIREVAHHGVLHVRCDLPADQVDQLERPHREAERSERLLYICDRRALVHGARGLSHDLRQEAVHDEARRISGEHRILAEALGYDEGRRQGLFVRH